MKTTIHFYRYGIILSSLLFSVFAYAAGSGPSELAPRIGMSPLDRAKIHSVQAQNWARMGTAEADAEDVSDSADSNTPGGISSSIGGSRNCTTNIGTRSAAKGISSGKYGPSRNSDNIVVVKGDVISLCK
ncbi:hypothetical protein HYE66_02990 [Aggregatibacter actinomycetemcomitans]|nr:hypothetical protein [Aggregatibacter actinomycetemcomitans]